MIGTIGLQLRWPDQFTGSTSGSSELVLARRTSGGPKELENPVGMRSKPTDSWGPKYEGDLVEEISGAGSVQACEDEQLAKGGNPDGKESIERVSGGR